MVASHIVTTPRLLFLKLSNMSPIVPLVLLVALTMVGASVIWPDDDRTSWDEFKVKYEKVYPNQEAHDTAKANFEKTASRVASQNEKFKKGLERSSLRINTFADMDEVEFKKTHSTGHVDGGVEGLVDCYGISAGSTQIPPESFTWQGQTNGNGHSMVSEVRQQGRCSDCWAFAAMGALESQMLIKNMNFVQLSTQQPTDCAKSGNGPYRSNGCNGGMFFDAWKYVMANGQDSEKDYAFVEHDEPCHDSRNLQKVVNVTRCGWFQPNRNDPDSIKNVLMTVGPMAVSVCAETWDMSYGGGLMPCRPTGARCPNPYTDKPQVTNHAVLLVGWGVDSSSGIPYWIIKNSWGPGWGVDGFVWVPMYSGSGESDCSMSVYSMGIVSIG